MVFLTRLPGSVDLQLLVVNHAEMVVACHHLKIAILLEKIVC